MGITGHHLRLQPHLPQQLRHRRIERTGRLVHQHHRRLHRQRPADGHALLLPAAQLPGVRVRLVRQSDTIEQPPGFHGRHRRGLPTHVDGRFHQVLQDGHVREEVELLEHKARLLSHLLQQCRIASTIQPRTQAQTTDFDVTCVKRLQPVQTPQQRALAPARRPDEHRHFARRHVQIRALQHLQRPKRLVHAANVNHAASPRASRRSSRRAKTDNG